LATAQNDRETLMASRKKGGFRTWTNSGGYQKFVDPRTGKSEYTHRRVAEKAIGGKIFPGYEVHHRDGDKTNNRPSNLDVIHEKVHHAIHAKKK
jgi:hypothetical protein